MEDSCLFKNNSFEDRLVTYCRGLSQRVWLTEYNFNDANNQSSHNCNRNLSESAAESWRSTNFKSMTLLHLAASLGFSR